MEARKCPECGSDLPADAPRGLCPRCLIKMGLESQHPTANSDAAGPASDDGRDVLDSGETFSDRAVSQRPPRLGGMRSGVGSPAGEPGGSPASWIALATGEAAGSQASP